MKNKSKEQNKLNSQRAITLIALVVTIVVLLILAGVSLNLVIGNNGIINKAKEASKASRRAEATDEVYLYWGEAQINYEYNIEQQVALLKERMQKYDENATATIEDNIIVNYKGYEIVLPYVENNKNRKISFFKIINDSSNVACMYITTDSKIYIYNQNNEICLNDKFPGLSKEINLRVDGEEGQTGNIKYLNLNSNKKILRLEYNTDNIFDINNYSLQEIFNIETIEGGKYNDKNVLTGFEFVYLLDDGICYSKQNEKLEELQLKEKKFKKISVVLTSRESATMVLIDSDGQIYDIQTGENLNMTLYNGIFKNENIKNTSPIMLKNNAYNVFINEEGKAYAINIETNEIKCINEMVKDLNGKKIKSVTNINGTEFNEIYIGIILEDGTAYYTEDMSNIYEFNTEKFPKLTNRIQ